MDKASTSINISTAYLVFNLPIYPRQIKRWRGAFIEMAGLEYDWLHNHVAGSEAVHNRYPRIQYRIAAHKGQNQKSFATIFGIGEGEVLLRQLIAKPELEWVLNWNRKAFPLSLTTFKLTTHCLQMSAPQSYQVQHWLALTSKNLQRWNNCNGLVERLQLLEKLLNNHLIATLWEVGWPKGEAYVQAIIQDYRQTGNMEYHEGVFMAFSIIFTLNMELPPLIAIGKGVSHGFGVIMPHRA